MIIPKIHRRMEDKGREFLTNVDLYLGNDGYAEPYHRRNEPQRTREDVREYYSIRFPEVKVEVDDMASDSQGNTLDGYVAVYLREIKKKQQVQKICYLIKKENN